LSAGLIPTEVFFFFGPNFLGRPMW
jgi:hypothetical protein